MLDEVKAFRQVESQMLDSLLERDFDKDEEHVYRMELERKDKRLKTNWYKEYLARA